MSSPAFENDGRGMQPGLLDLPNELLFLVATKLRVADVNMFHQTSKFFHALLGGHLYKLGATELLKQRVDPFDPSSGSYFRLRDDCRMALHRACESFNIIAIRKLLAADAHPDGFYRARRLEDTSRYPQWKYARQPLPIGPLLVSSPLQIAVQAHSLPMVSLLLEHGANPNLPTSEPDKSLLHIAAKTGWADLCGTLLVAGAWVDAGAGRTTTALHMAAAYGHEGVSKVLLDGGADPNVTGHGNLRNTPLHFAAANGHVGVLTVLLDYGAEIEVKDKCGKTAMSYALRGRQEEAVAFLRSRGARTTKKRALVVDCA